MPGAETVDAQAKDLLSDLPALRLPLDVDELAAAFTAKVSSEKLTGTFEHLPDMASVPLSVSAYRQAKEIKGPLTLSSDPVVAGLDWRDEPVTSDISAHASMALSVARLAVAETGSLVVASSPDAPSLHNFLPLHHLVVLPVSRIWPYLENVWHELDPRAHRLVSLITGTSGTADIEGRNVRGAHGPRFLHVMLIDSS